jgi:prophage maintenance system killer protein
MAKILRESLLEEIESAKKRIDAKKMRDYVSLMHQDLVRQVIENAPKFDVDNRIRGEKVISAFREAWNYGIMTFPRENLDTLFLQNLSGKIEPDLDSQDKGYSPLRNQMVKLDFGRSGVYIPPVDRERIINHLDRMNNAIESLSLHPLEEATYLNFHLMRIQPFDNGNKRLANIVMNLTLYDEGFFPINLNEKDREVYKEFWKAAVLEFRENGAKFSRPQEAYINLGNAQTQFYDFLGRRELNELRFAEDRLKGLPSYVIELDVKDRGKIYAVKKNIRSWFVRRSVPYQERLNSEKRTLEVIGDIPENVLKTILKDRGAKYKLRQNGTH